MSATTATTDPLDVTLGYLDKSAAELGVTRAKDGTVVFAGGSLVRGLAASPSGTAQLEPTEAVAVAAEALALEEPADLRVLSESAGPARETVVSDGGIADAPIPVRLGWHPTAGGLRKAWQLVIDASSDDSLWNATVDAETGRLLGSDDWTAKDRVDALASTLAPAGGSPEDERLRSGRCRPDHAESRQRRLELQRRRMAEGEPERRAGDDRVQSR